jgi:hypothetical protein
MQVSLAFVKNHYKSVIIDFSALLLIYFVPALSHLISFPVYLVEPMRIMLILAMVHTSRNNAYLLALTLPLFSFLVSAHPNIFKGLIMTGELVLNVWLFYEISKRINNLFFSMMTAVILSKIVYYLLKLGIISFGLIESGLFATPIWLQIIMVVILSCYPVFFLRNRELSK